jgi:UDP-N-acetylglucosamine:LPS N-acetylglucosamine transferase
VDDHQTKNAYIMADVMGAKVITEDELDSSSLTSTIEEVFGTWHMNSLHSLFIEFTTSVL